MDRTFVEKVREFNRYYLVAMNLLGNHYLDSEYSASDARVLFELYDNNGCNAKDIVESLHIDKSYLSKILAKYEKQGYLDRIPSIKDKRYYDLYLNDKGKAMAEELMEKSNVDIANILQHLDNEQQQLFIQSLETITRLLRKEDSDESCTI
ncbi:MAG: MarR family transcriptional regulator [Erysipelotrichaceae bacterium]|nr:MarR family transcriptional regulator [Erysipelotrichaceae bacterium]